MVNVMQHKIVTSSVRSNTCTNIEQHTLIEEAPVRLRDDDEVHQLYTNICKKLPHVFQELLEMFCALACFGSVELGTAISKWKQQAQFVVYPVRHKPQA
jgi:hypothetical protein